MASLLRSGKFIRFFANFTRNITFGGGNRTDPDALLLPARQENWKIQIHRFVEVFWLMEPHLEPAPRGFAVPVLTAILLYLRYYFTFLA